MALVGVVAEGVGECFDGVLAGDGVAGSVEFGVEFGEGEGAVLFEDVAAVGAEASSPEGCGVVWGGWDGFASVGGGASAEFGEVDPESVVEGASLEVELVALAAELADLLVEFGDLAVELVVVVLEGASFVADEG